MKKRTVIVRGVKIKQNPDLKSAKLARKARGTDSNVRLAKRIGVSVWTAWCWTHGAIVPNKKNMGKLRKLVKG